MRAFIILFGALFSATLLCAEFGLSYQTWNKPLGVFQTKEQLEYDLQKIKQLGVTSLRVELPWGLIEPENGKFDFTYSDLLLKKAKEYNLKLLPIIGFQWAPSWFPDRLKLGFIDQTRSAIINYAHPEAAKYYERILKTIVSRYKNNPSIMAWIIGNEFNYIDYLSQKQMGYDPESKIYFINFLQKKYGTIQTLNKAWSRNYPSFKEISITDYIVATNYQVEFAPINYSQAIIDFLEFRENAIANLVAIGCKTTQKFDPAAKRTYSSIGVLYLPTNAGMTSDNPSKNAKACNDAGAPLSFYSINSYPNLNSQEHFNLALSYELTKSLTSLDVIFSEYGITSTDIYLQTDELRQSKYLKAMRLDNLFEGIATNHLFTWQDKPFVDVRERGFGIVSEKRHEKPSYFSEKKLIEKLQPVNLKRFFATQIDNKIAFLTPDEKRGISEWPTWINETWIVASYLRHLNIPVTFVTPEKLKDSSTKKSIHTLVISHINTLTEETFNEIEKANFNVIYTGNSPGFLEDQTQMSSLRRNFLEKLVQFLGIEELTYPNIPLSERSVRYQLIYNGDTGFLATLMPPAEIKPDLNSKTYGTLRLLDVKEKNSFPLFIERTLLKRKIIFLPQSLGANLSSKLIEDHHEKMTYKASKHLIVKIFYDIFKNHLNYSADYQTPSINNKTKEDSILVKYKKNSDGELFFIQHMPKIYTFDNTVCNDKKSQKVTLQTTALANLVDLASGEVFRANSKGTLKFQLTECDSKLLISKALAPIAKVSPVEKKSLTLPRPSLFPDRVLLLKNNICHQNALKNLGYKESPLEVPHSPDYKKWYRLEEKSFHITDQLKEHEWSNFFQTALVDSSELTALTEKSLKLFLLSQKSRTIIFGKQPKSLQKVSKEKVLNLMTCDEMSYEKMGRFLTTNI